MRVRIDPAGNMQFVGLDPICAETLTMLPDILRSEDPDVRQRLLPDVYPDDGEASDEWRRLEVPSLEHLFASRTDLVESDLATLGVDEDAEFSVLIPGTHRSAWLSALNAARITLFVTSGLQAEDIEVEPGTLGDPEMDLTLARIDALAFVQHLLLEAREVTDGIPPSDDDPTEAEDGAAD